MTPQTQDPFGLVGQRLEGKYDVAALVAEGGFGVVYRGTHVGLERPVAIKVLKPPPALDDAARAAFLATFAAEARLIARLDHPAIVRVLDFGAGPLPAGPSAPWMVLEWLAGTTLEAVLEARRGQGGCAPAACLARLRPVFDALADAHAAGIAHRDLKPANLMLVAGRDGAPTLKLLDFGIAKVMRPDEAVATGQTATAAALRAFSPRYAAPEQLGGLRTGPWTDVHALALLVTELLTDLPPYDGADLVELYGAITAPQRPTPARRGLDVGPWEPVLARALALKPAARYADAAALHAALAAAVPAVAQWGGAPMPTVLAPPPTATPTTLRPGERPAPPPRRWPVALGAALAGGALAAALVASVAGRAPPDTTPRATPTAVPPAPRAAIAPATDDVPRVHVPAPSPALSPAPATQPVATAPAPRGASPRRPPPARRSRTALTPGAFAVDPTTDRVPTE